jgi:DNA-binding NtrC family response regulator
MTTKPGHILIVDDDEDILIAGKLLLERHFGTVITSDQPENMTELMVAQMIDVILLDMNFGPGESSCSQGLYWLSNALQVDPQVVVIMITAHGDLALAVDAMKKGATDFIVKPWQNEKLVATVAAGLKLRGSRGETEQLKKTNRLLASASGKTEQVILGQSAAISKVTSLIKRAGPSDANVLILGENGTGKELVARQLHHHSPRAGQVFMSVDMGALPETLFETELFGHKKGAFSGAHSDRIGRFHAADGGTLFLDEIGNIPLHLQSKLLAVLEQRQVSPLGDNEPTAFDVRIIAATNIPRQKISSDHYFRQDLLFRLNTVEIVLPPLREREDDIKEIAVYYASLYARKYGKSVKPISPTALVAMRNYSWPGNIRALRHAIERAVVLSEGPLLETWDFPLQDQSELGIPENPQRTGNTGAEILPDLNLAQVEKTTIVGALQKHRYNISYTAKALGLTRAALYRRMEKYGL